MIRMRPMSLFRTAGAGAAESSAGIDAACYHEFRSGCLPHLRRCRFALSSCFGYLPLVESSMKVLRQGQCADSMS